MKPLNVGLMLPETPNNKNQKYVAKRNHANFDNSIDKWIK